MDTNDYYSDEVFEYKLTHWLYIGLLVVIGVLAVYFLWRWCREQPESTQNKDGDKTTSGSGRMFMKPVYAHEIEPGIVVLQSEEGDYFKVLKEYNLNSTNGNQYGSLSCTKPEITKSTDDHVIPIVDQSAITSATRRPIGIHHTDSSRDPLLGSTTKRNDFNAIELMSYTGN